MKRLAVLCSILCLSFLSTGVFASLGERWVQVPVSSGGVPMFVTVPTIDFKAEKVTASQYQLSWKAQGGLSSYRIERLSLDSVNDSGDLTLPTAWEEIANTTARSLTVNHDLRSFDLGGHQTYRLSQCQQSVCEPLAQLSYFILADDIQNSIPQQFYLTEDTPTSTSQFDFNGKDNTKTSQHDYRRGYGFSMVSGHSDETLESSGVSIKGNDVKPLMRTASVETRRFTLHWQPVDNATHYVVMRSVDKSNYPTKSFLNKTIRAHKAETTQYYYELVSGDYTFEVYGCTSKLYATSKKHEFCGGAVPAKTITPRLPYHPNENLQPNNVYLSDADGDGIVAYQERFTLHFENPNIYSMTGMELISFHVLGELSGIISGTVSTPTDQQPEGYDIDRNVGYYGNPILQAGRQYCYKVLPVYRDLTQPGNVTMYGEPGYPSPAQCIQVGHEPVIKAPDYLTTVRQITDSNAPKTKGLGFSWGFKKDELSGKEQIPTGIINYQLDRELPVGSGDWHPVHYGPEKYKVLELKAIGDNDSYAFRVSACDGHNRCGNYRRLYFHADGFSTAQLGADYYKPQCLYVPPEINSGNALGIEWCRPESSPYVDYVIHDATKKLVFDSRQSSYTTTDNGMLKAELNHITNQSLERRCFTVSTVLSNSKEYPSDEYCTTIRPRAPSNFVALTGGNHAGDVLLDWDDMASTSAYIVSEGFCGEVGCTEPTMWREITGIAGITASQLATNLSNDGTYFYVVKACYDNLCSPDSPRLSVVATRPNVPNQPSISLTDGATRTFLLDWPDVAGAQDYVVEWADCDGDCNAITASQWQQKGVSTTSQLSMPQMTSGHFAFSVKACQVVCSERSTSAILALNVAQTPLNPIVSIVDIAANTYQLRWHAVVNASVYKVQWALCGSDCSSVTASDWQTAATVSNSNVWPFTTQSGQKYSLRVAACNNDICSDYSSIVDMPSGQRATIFLHSDNLGSPVAETNEQGEEL